MEAVSDEMIIGRCVLNDQFIYGYQS
jgi:hypothetical protein